MFIHDTLFTGSVSYIECLLDIFKLGKYYSNYILFVAGEPVLVIYIPNDGLK